MSDWADERAMALFLEYGDDVGVMDVAAALRQARIDALEEAARMVTENYQALCTEHRLLLGNRAAAIRALKDKQP